MRTFPYILNIAEKKRFAKHFSLCFESAFFKFTDNLSFYIGRRRKSIRK